MDVSKLGPMDSDAAHAITLIDRLCTIRRSIEANAMRPDFSVDVDTNLNAQQAAIFREIHQVVDKLEIKTR